jgi:hypothetical protein
MKLNCKPGDLAVCIRDVIQPWPESPLGRLCDVLYAAPVGSFTLPDGYRSQGAGHKPYWVVKWQNTLLYPTMGEPRRTQYGLCPDSVLRPIRDNDGEDETLQWVPRKVTA